MGDGRPATEVTIAVSGIAVGGDGVVYLADMAHQRIRRVGATTIDRAAPVTVAGLTGVRSVSAGIGHTLAVRSNGSVWSWGYNNAGQLGRAGTTSSSTPAAVPGLVGITSVAAGGYHSHAVQSDGSVVSWGWNLLGQLGDGTTTDSHTPVPATVVTGVQSISTGVAHTLVIA